MLKKNIAIGQAKNNAKLAIVENKSLQPVISDIKTTFFHTAIIHINTSHAREYNILFLDSLTTSSLQVAVIILIHCNTKTNKQRATTEICKKVNIFHKTEPKTSELINIFLL
jgi:hypothetical protein